MTRIAHAPWLQDVLAQQEEQRAVKRLVLAVAQQLRLNVQAPSLLLAPLMGQPLTRHNQEALEQWVEETLDDLGLPAEMAAVAPLCDRLACLLEEEH